MEQTFYVSLMNQIFFLRKFVLLRCINASLRRIVTAINAGETRTRSFRTMFGDLGSIRNHQSIILFMN
jgi:hypothetical protein